MIKQIALRENIIWSPCQIDIKNEVINSLELISMDEIKNSIYFQKILFKSRWLVYYNQNNYGFYYDTMDIENTEKFENSIERAENGIISRITSMKKRGRDCVR